MNTTPPPASLTISSIAHEVQMPKVLHTLLVMGSHWPPEVVRALWAWACASPKPAVGRFVEATAKMSNVFGLKDQHACDRLTTAYLQHTLTATFLVEALEALCEAGTLDRVQATTLEERIFGSVDRR